MANYILSFHGGGMPETPEEQAAVMAAWGAWYGALGEAVIDGGNPVGQIRTIAPDGSTSGGGGNNPVTGYSVIAATDMDDAVAKCMDCPILASGGSIEVGETFAVM